MEDKIYFEIRDNIVSYFTNTGYNMKIGKINDIDNFILYFTVENDVKKDLIWTSIQSDPKRERFVMKFITRKRINIIESFFSLEYLKKMEDTRTEIYTINLYP